MALTPMMQQYLRMKQEYADCLLFFRLGDFYEMFFEDARIVSRELELTLTGKDCGLEERAPMCGVPYHAVDVYIQKLIEKGYKVAICEQMEDPAQAKGLVERAVTRIVTPGTVIEQNMLEDKRPNYILSVYLKKDRAGLTYCDVSTGEFCLYQIASARLMLADEIAHIMPSEILVNDREALGQILPLRDIAVSEVEPDDWQYGVAARMMQGHFNQSVSEMGFAAEKNAVCAAGALLKYLTLTQKNSLAHILTAKRLEIERCMALDHIALHNLELTQTVRSHARKGSLLWIMDHTVTSMGSRMLRSWIEQPLMDRLAIERRLDAVEALKNDQIALSALTDAMDDVYDVERLLSRIAYDAVNPRECLALCTSLLAVPQIKRLLDDVPSEAIEDLNRLMDPLTDTAELIASAIDEKAPISVKDGGIFKNGYSDELDKLREASTQGKTWLADLEAREREATGIKNLKIGYNRVFGYFIEVTKSFYDMVPYRYVRKQTLANCERFITEELKEMEQTILGADENALKLEYDLFVDLRGHLKQQLKRLNRTAQALKELDALMSMAKLAIENGYVRPSLNEEGRYEIKNGRHPVVEEGIGRESFVPNDTRLNQNERVMIITGPNMAGKSTYMRQVALIVLMAHMGSFVPADQADIAITDRIFTRIGASDDLYAGQSTFMVEMSEMANILKHATSNSLVILDEVGRGTSTFDGLSIAWAAVEYIAGEKCGARTLFATHYHELSELEGQLPGVVNYRITAIEQGHDVIFLRKIVPGGADHSYGVAVASLAGLPSTLISRARQIMARLEVDGQQRGSIGQSILDKRKNGGDRQVSLLDSPAMELVEEIQKLDVMSMSPIDALNKLYELNEKARRI